jgi:hypothetical protein
MALLAAAVGTALLGVWMAVTDPPLQFFSGGLGVLAFSAIVWAFNERRRGDDRWREDYARLRKELAHTQKENAHLRDAMLRLLESPRIVDPQTRRDVREVIQHGVDDDDGEAL